MEITKTDFEKSLPVGMRANTDVFDKVSPEIERQQHVLQRDLLGETGTEIVNADGADEFLVREYKSLVCIRAFLTVLRQLDLVLTPTGFGVVSNQNTAPASKTRVDILETSLRTALMRARADVIMMLRSDKWGTSIQARRAIPTLFTPYYFCYESTFQFVAAAETWEKVQQPIAEAWSEIRRYIGDEMTDELLDAYRKADSDRLETYNPVIEAIQYIIDRWTQVGHVVTHGAEWRRLFTYLDADPVAFRLYKDSAAYKLTHHEHFKNSPDSTAYVFNG